MIEISCADPIVYNLFQGKLTALLIQAPKFCDVPGILLHSTSTGLLKLGLLLTALHRPASCPYVKHTSVSPTRLRLSFSRKILLTAPFVEGSDPSTALGIPPPPDVFLMRLLPFGALTSRSQSSDVSRRRATAQSCTIALVGRAHIFVGEGERESHYSLPPTTHSRWTQAHSPSPRHSLASGAYPMT